MEEKANEKYILILLRSTCKVPQNKQKDHRKHAIHVAISVE